MGNNLTHQEFEVGFSDLLERMESLVLKKNHDYAGTVDPLSNLRMCEKAGIPAWKGIAAVRMADKFSRILNFCNTEDLKVKSESVEDTLIDLANYSLLCVLAFRDYKKSQGVEETTTND